MGGHDIHRLESRWDRRNLDCLVESKIRTEPQSKPITDYMLPLTSIYIYSLKNNQKQQTQYSRVHENFFGEPGNFIRDHAQTHREKALQQDTKRA